VLRQQIKAVGDRPLLWSTLGQSLMRHGEWQEASIAFRAALSSVRMPLITPGWPMPWTACISRKKRRMRRDGLLLTLQNNPQP
jgi:HemY protein